MRITCPNCDAQYEVDERAIPDGGRDVQCSNCGHAWFQLPPHLEHASDEEAEGLPNPAAAGAEGIAKATEEAGPGSAYDEDYDEGYEDEPFGEAAPSEAQPTPAPPARAPEAPPATIITHSGPRPPPILEDEDEDDDFEDLISPRLTPAPQRRALDENIQAVLREEAERERTARAAEGGTPAAPPSAAPSPVSPISVSPSRPSWMDEDEDKEDEPVIPTTRRTLTPAADEADEATEEAHAEGEETDADADGDAEADQGHAAAGARRDLLPDIEQINSTLTAAGSVHGAAAVAVAPPPVQRDGMRGFRVGFRLVLLIVVLGLIAYVLAPAIAARVPAAGPYLNGYVGLIDSGRLWLNRQLLSAVAQMNH